MLLHLYNPFETVRGAGSAFGRASTTCHAFQKVTPTSPTCRLCVSSTHLSSCLESLTGCTVMPATVSWEVPVCLLQLNPPWAGLKVKLDSGL